MNKKVFTSNHWDLISQRDQRFKMKVITEPPIIKKHFISS